LAQIACWVLLTLVVLVVIGLIAGSGEKKQDVAVVRSDASATPASVTTTTALTTTTEPTTTTTTTEPPTTAAPPVYLMPNIPCGTDLQAAQDRVQKAGVFYSRSEDATGQGRNQIIDSNWTVLSQDPAPGTPISEGDPVFYVVKDTEFSGC
jgi:hypothetical protein